MNCAELSRPGKAQRRSRASPPRVLVSGASGIVGYGILKCLRLAPNLLHLTGTSLYEDSVAPAFCDQFEQAPHTEDPSYLPWLLNLIQTHAIDVLIPGIEADLHLWSNHREQLAETGAQLSLNTQELIEKTRDKWIFYEALEAVDSPYRIPSSLNGRWTWKEACEAFGPKLILKPRSGYASRGLLRVESREQWEAQRHRVGPELLVQPQIGREDAEYTVAIFGDGEGQSVASIALRRVLSAEGFTGKAQPVPSKPFEPAIEHLCRLFRPIGPTNLQFRLHEDHPYLLEINPRISSSVSLRCAFGYNEPAMAVRHLLEGVLPQQPTLRSGRAIRYWEDCLFLDPAPEPEGKLPTHCFSKPPPTASDTARESRPTWG
jgi:carbamoyl-phosphate synthase large subunit